jgi:hypothetical protein
MGMRHVFSIVDKHANGVERVNKEVVRHLRCLVWDRNIRDVFDDPTVIPSVQYILNTHVSSETGFSPFELTFGSSDKIYGDLLKDCSGRPVHTLQAERELKYSQSSQHGVPTVTYIIQNIQGEGGCAEPVPRRGPGVVRCRA